MTKTDEYVDNVAAPEKKRKIQNIGKFGASPPAAPKTTCETIPSIETYFRPYLK